MPQREILLMVLLGVVILRDCSALLLLFFACCTAVDAGEGALPADNNQEGHRLTAAPTRLIVSEAARLSLD